jgi:hypothetical protein
MPPYSLFEPAFVRRMLPQGSKLDASPTVRVYAH